MCFDEFKSVKSAKGAMSFIFCDSETGRILDIVEDRRLHVLNDYFLRYSKAARNSVKTIVIDMYSPYISLVKSIFPKSKIIIDKFHIIQLFSRALNKTRIKIMNLDKDKKNYNKLKGIGSFYSRINQRLIIITTITIMLLKIKCVRLI